MNQNRIFIFYCYEMLNCLESMKFLFQKVVFTLVLPNVNEMEFID